MTVKEVREGIFFAIQAKQDEILDILLEKEENVAALVDDFTGQQNPIFIFASCFGTPHAIERLLEKGADPLVTAMSYNALHVAVQQENDAVAEFLVREKKVPLDALTEDDRRVTALAVLINRVELDLIRLFVDHGADINCPVTDEQLTPMHLAFSKEKSLEIIRILLTSKHPYLNLQDKKGTTPIDLAALFKKNEEMGLLLQAVWDQGEEKAKELLSHNTKVEITLGDDLEEASPPGKPSGSIEGSHSPNMGKDKKKKRCVIQ